MTLQQMIEAAQLRAAARKRRAAEVAQATLMARLEEMMRLAATQFGTAFTDLSHAGLVAGGSLKVDPSSEPPLVTPVLRIATEPERIFLLYDWNTHAWFLARIGLAQSVAVPGQAPSPFDELPVAVVQDDPYESGDNLLLAIADLLRRIRA